jgi:hypothetical protein
MDVDEVTQKITGKGPESERKIKVTRPFAAFVQNLRTAESAISSDQNLFNAYQAAGGNFDRLRTQRTGREEDPKLDTYRITLDGKPLEGAQTGFDGVKAIEFMRGKDLVIKELGYKVIQSKEEATSETAPQCVAERVRAKFGKTEQAPGAQMQTGMPAAQQQGAAPQTIVEELGQVPETSGGRAAAVPGAGRVKPEVVERVKSKQKKEEAIKERNSIQAALYDVDRRGTKKLKAKFDPNSDVVKKALDRLKEIEKELASL